MSDIYILSIKDDHYPSLLKEIHTPPQQLYIRGNKELLLHPRLLAVVGSRNTTEYGIRAMKAVLPEVVSAHTPLVSGLALGIDAHAHKLCIEYGQPTIAVLGSGVDDGSIYPRTNFSLAQEILASGGALVSEYPPNTKPHKAHFPARNRIVAGLCRATLIIQAAQKSGSLITARLAMEANRDVLVIPGPITDPLHAGTNALIRDGATPVVESNDILTVLEPYAAPASTQIPLNLTH